MSNRVLILPSEPPEVYKEAIGGDGPLAYTWTDKPHRLVYDLVRGIEAAREALERLLRKHSSPGAVEDACHCEDCEFAREILSALQPQGDQP